MSLGGAVRRAAFWSLDAARGGAVRRHHQDIAAVMAGRPPDPAVLERLLEHATATTPAYEPCASRPLSAFPVLTKADLKGAPERYRSRAYPGAGLQLRRTSGSTGVPLVVAHDAAKRERATADVIWFNARAGYAIGEPLMWLYATNVVSMSERVRRMRNIEPVDHVGLDEARLAAIAERLGQRRFQAVLGIPTTLFAVARHLERSAPLPGHRRPAVVISTGETLDPSVQRRIAAAFGCPVVNRYANEENGVLAATAPGSDRLMLNRASFLFEFLRFDADEPQAPGRLARVVVTDLYARAMPLIRYDTGDLAIVAEHGDGPATELLSVEGRRADVIRTSSGGQLAAPSVSALMVRRFPDLEQYRLEQLAPASYRLMVVRGRSGYPDAELLGALGELLGDDASISIEAVDELPQDASGKRRSVVSRIEEASR